MTFITGVIRNQVHKNRLGGKSFVLSTLFTQLLSHSISIASIYVSNHEKFQETHYFEKPACLQYL